MLGTANGELDIDQLSWAVPYRLLLSTLMTVAIDKLGSDEHDKI
jgi:hypothetical protein